VPELGGDTYIGLLVAVSAAVTWALRLLPFAALAPMRDSAIIRYLSRHMPVGVMAILALYTLNGAPAAGLDLAWLAVGLLVTAGLHLWRGQALLSILVGTASYVVLMSLWS
jgi:branched-subunit amino acid transport protein AzlD